MNDEPIILGSQPVLNIADRDAAVAHYVEWLGFTLDWEWQAQPGAPAMLFVTRDGLSMFLTESPDESAASLIRVQVANLPALVAEWNLQRPDAIAVLSEPPYELPTAYVKDPFGNVLALQQPDSAAEQQARQALATRIRTHLQDLHSSGAARPSPEAIVATVGGTLGIAGEVLAEFPNWE